MNCPVCGDPLREIEKFQVRIDICPGCKGVWLDRGELEKIVDLAAREPVTTPPEVRGSLPVEPRGYPPPETPPHDGRHPGYYRPEDGHHHGKHEGEYRRHKKGGWLGELFEVFD